MPWIGNEFYYGVNRLKRLAKGYRKEVDSRRNGWWLASDAKADFDMALKFLGKRSSLLGEGLSITDLKEMAEWLNKNKDVKLVIEGHCDERGTAEYNVALGERRAAAAAKYLTDMGVDGRRITTISYGFERPVDPGGYCWTVQPSVGQQPRGILDPVLPAGDHLP